MTCPLPRSDDSRVQLGHGGGGRLMHDLLNRLVLPSLDVASLAEQHDGARVSVGGVELAFTTDSYVVQPLFFPGGDVGSLAVHGTVNDLVVCGARPLCLSVGLVLEEGLPFETLERALLSMREAAANASVRIVTGDTKVVERGKGDGLFVNTSGIGVVTLGRRISPRNIRAGDAILVSGDVGRHGVAILSQREGLEFESPIQSDSAPLTEPVFSLLDEGHDVRFMRDVTRGGLTAVLVELAEASGLGLVVHENAIPVREEVRGACELLGLDPMDVACEGRFLCVVPEEEAEPVLARLRGHSACTQAARIGVVSSGAAAEVEIESAIGVRRALHLPRGEELPRIC